MKQWWHQRRRMDQSLEYEGGGAAASTHDEVHRQSYMGKMHASVTHVNICPAVGYGQTGPQYVMTATLSHQ